MHRQGCNIHRCRRLCSHTLYRHHSHGSSHNNQGPLLSRVPRNRKESHQRQSSHRIRMWIRFTWACTILLTLMTPQKYPRSSCRSDDSHNSRSHRCSTLLQAYSHPMHYCLCMDRRSTVARYRFQMAPGKCSDRYQMLSGYHRCSHCIMSAYMRLST